MDKAAKEYCRFFKFFCPERNGRILKIPPAYTRSMQGNLPAKVFLKDRYGNLWTVDIEAIQSGLYFGGGWSKFVQDNSLEEGDFIVFEYDGFDVFDVKLLGCNGCEKEGVGGPRTRFNEEEDQEEEHSEVEDIKEEVEEKNEDSSESTGKDDDDDDKEPISTSKECATIPKSKPCGSKHLKKMNSCPHSRH